MKIKKKYVVSQKVFHLNHIPFCVCVANKLNGRYCQGVELKSFKSTTLDQRLITSTTSFCSSHKIRLCVM